MRIGLLKRSFIALLILALASACLVAPSFATQPCGMDKGSMLAASGSCTGHCKSVAGDCTKATICCGILTNLAMPSVSSVTPVDWDQVAYPDDLQSLAGRRLAACRTEALPLNAEGDFAVVGFRLALDRTLIPVWPPIMTGNSPLFPCASSRPAS